MSDETDPITDAVLSESAYERIRYTEGIITQPVLRTLTFQAGLLALLASILPLYAFYPSSVSEHVPTLDPFLAAPKLLFLGLVGWVTEVSAALLLAGLWYYRQRRVPLTEAQARTVFDVEQIAAGLSIVTGGLAIVVTVGLVAIGVFGEATMATYLGSIAGDDVFAQTATGISVGHLSMLSGLGCLVVLAIRGHLGRNAS
ncbi:MAG: hypothetical protein V5A34_12325 [Halapricum sp.]